MPNTAHTTNPLSYSEAFSTFRAAECTARGTDLRGKSLVNLDVFGPVPNGLVAELGSKLRPAGIQNGLRHAGLGKSGSIHVADADAPVLPHEVGRQPMQEVLTAVGDLAWIARALTLRPAR